MITKEMIDDFSESIEYDVRAFLTKFSLFVSNNLPSITLYFKGKTRVADANSFAALKTLNKEIVKLFEQINSNKSSLTNYKNWVIIETLEEVKAKIETINNLSRWLRSSITEVSYSEPTVEITLKQSQTLEMLVQSLGSNDALNSWKDIAIDNSLREEDYTNDGGNLLKVKLQTADILFLNTVIDNIQGENVYGKDLKRKLTFENNDLVVLSPFESFVQTCEILSQLKKKDNPDAPNDGLNEKFIIGSNIALLGFPTIIRQMTAVFAQDDIITSFSVTSIKREEDAVYI